MQDNLILTSVTEFIKSLGSDPEKLSIAVSYSGGADSGVLLDILVKLLNDQMISELAIVYFNHNLRGEESGAEASFVKETAVKYDLDLIEFSLDVIKFSAENKLTVETAARKLRYSRYEELYDNFDYIAQGHHSNDNAETVLYNILRGSGLEGASGIKKIRGKFIRPLLDFSKADILDYAGKNAVGFINDSTNSKSDFSRNKIRNLIMPLIEKELNRKVTASIVRFSVIVSEADEVISSETEKYVRKYVRLNQTAGFLNLTCVSKLHSVFFKRIIIRICRSLGSEYSLSSFNLNSLLKKIGEGNSFHTKICDTVITRHQNNLIFTKDNFTMDSRIILSKVVKSPYYFDLSKIKGELRTEIIDLKDSFIPFGKNREEKISKVLSDKKIPLIFRNGLKCIRDEEKIIFIQGAGISESVKTEPATKNICYIRLTNDILKKLF